MNQGQNCPTCEIIGIFEWGFLQHLLVDEFQDTNDDQFELLNHLIRNKENIFIVGDPDQMIYS